MVGRLVSGVGTLKRRFQEALAKLPRRLIMATTPRILAEDLPECLREVSSPLPASRRRPVLRDLEDLHHLAGRKLIGGAPGW